MNTPNLAANNAINPISSLIEPRWFQAIKKPLDQGTQWLFDCDSMKVSCLRRIGVSIRQFLINLCHQTADLLLPAGIGLGATGSGWRLLGLLQE